MPRNNAPFITLEGGEGAGKSTQLNLLADRLEEQGIRLIRTREPEGPVRRILVEGEEEFTPEAEALLHYAARADHLKQMIRPALSRGDWVLCDRFADSTMAYQGVVQGAGQEFVQKLHALVVKETVPDLTLVLDLPVGEGLSRAQARGGHENRYEQLGETFHDLLRWAFLDIAKAEPDRCVVIDASGEVEDVRERIWQVVASRFNLR